MTSRKMSGDKTEARIVVVETNTGCTLLNLSLVSYSKTKARGLPCFLTSHACLSIIQNESKFMDTCGSLGKLNLLGCRFNVADVATDLRLAQYNQCGAY